MPKVVVRTCKMPQELTGTNVLLAQPVTNLTRSLTRCMFDGHTCLLTQQLTQPLTEAVSL